MQKLVLVPELIEAVSEGIKKCTIRSGRRHIVPGQLVFESTEGNRAIFVNVTKVLIKPLKDVPLVMIKADGANTHEEMLEALKRFYPDMTLDSVVTAILFK